MYPSDVEAATALAPAEVINELLMLGFAPTTGIDIVAQSRVGNLVALARSEDDVVAFVSLSDRPTTTFGTLFGTGELLFTSNAHQATVTFPKVGYTSQKFRVPLPDLFARHLEDVDGRAEPGHTAPVFALALQRRHAEINESRRNAAARGLQIINFATLAAVAATGAFLGLVIVPLIIDGLSPAVAMVCLLPALVMAGLAAQANFGKTPYGRPVTQYVGLGFGAGLPHRSVDETLALGDAVETGR